MFKKGDLVTCTMMGDGEVIDVSDSDHNQAVRALFNGFTIYYSRDGKFYKEAKARSLYLRDEFPEELRKYFKEPLPDLAVDTPIFVRDSEHYPWVMRCFSHWEIGLCHTFYDGKTSESQSATMAWRYWELP